MLTDFNKRILNLSENIFFYLPKLPEKWTHDFNGLEILPLGRQWIPITISVILAVPLALIYTGLAVVYFGYIKPHPEFDIITWSILLIVCGFYIAALGLLAAYVPRFNAKLGYLNEVFKVERHYVKLRTLNTIRTPGHFMLFSIICYYSAAGLGQYL